MGGGVYCRLCFVSLLRLCLTLRHLFVFLFSNQRLFVVERTNQIQDGSCVLYTQFLNDYFAREEEEEESEKIVWIEMAVCHISKLDGFPVEKDGKNT
jgi:hypothetical protein